MDFSYLAELLFPDVKEIPEELELRYPKRDLPEGAKVTRFAPSPTGFVHFGGLFPSMTGERLAHQSGGVFFLRIEDTDAKREVPGAAEGLIKTLARYGIEFDEGAVIGDDGKITDRGAYGPYKQSLRRDIYRVYAKRLVSEGKAYPVFTTAEELDALNAADKKAEVKNRVWTEEAAAEQKAEMLAQRNFTVDEVKAHLEVGDRFVLRILADGDGKRTVKASDLVRGALEFPENDEDFVLLKSDGIPTYHFAHAVDDHLMGTTHVIRGEEWLPSLPKHVQLFRYLGFMLPKYMHIAQIMHLDENGNNQKLSRRDMGANMDDYPRMGYSPEAVCEYVMTLLNSNYEEWHMQNPDKNYRDFPFSIKKMSVSGCLFDFGKLNDVSRNILSGMTAEQVYDGLTGWAAEFDPEFAAELTRDPEYTKSILAIGRGGKKPRKDLAVWSDAKPYMGFFYDRYFAVTDSIPDSFSREDVNAVLTGFLDSYDEGDDMNVWFEKIKRIAAALGYAADMKEYKADPQAFKGSVADVSMFIRVAVTGKMNSPDLYTVMHILGKERTEARLRAMLI